LFVYFFELNNVLVISPLTWRHVFSCHCSEKGTACVSVPQTGAALPPMQTWTLN